MTNPNDFPLQNVVISEIDALPAGTTCSANGNPVTLPFTVPFLDAHASFTIDCTGQVPCPGPTVNSFQAQGEVSPTTSVCAIGTDGQPVKSEVCRSSASVSCEVVTQGCRTTGGGKQPSANTCPVVKYVTHGGQVGAPFGQAGAPDCASSAGFNNPCIRGEFTHVRHIKGGLRGNFHAASNGNIHEFDSLMCACLPCDHTDVNSCNPGGCHPQDRTYSSQNATVNGLCNRGDRVCGPEPRRAPANKICFSGVGNYTMSNGRRTPQSVVFRVDLEDRSEPGGAHPRGGTPPPDRYRMRMWFINAGTADTDAVKALRATVACKDPLTEVIPCTLDCVGGRTPAPDIDDGGDLDRGNRQIHPNTGATCQ